MEARQGAESQVSHSRRQFLKWAALGLAGAAALSASITSLFSESSRKPVSTDLPGEGSIFQPRQDARLEEWLRKHGKR